jgi:thiol-disulfide isomerase/thioredoxin
MRLRHFAAALTAVCLLLPAYAKPTLESARFTELATNKPISLPSLHGRVTVVNFWATWCGPCREEMPMLDSLARKLGPRGVTVVGVALDNKADVQPFVKQLKISYPIWLGDADTLNLMRSSGNVSGGLPYTVVLDRNGKPVATLLGQLNEKLVMDALRRHL